MNEKKNCGKTERKLLTLIGLAVWKRAHRNLFVGNALTPNRKKEEQTGGNRLKNTLQIQENVLLHEICVYLKLRHEIMCNKFAD